MMKALDLCFLARSRYLSAAHFLISVSIVVLIQVFSIFKEAEKGSKFNVLGRRPTFSWTTLYSLWAKQLLPH